VGKLIFYEFAILLIALSFITPAVAQAAVISLTFSTSLPMPIGQTTTVSVVITDTSNSTVQLNFVGVRFEWSSPDKFFIGANSEKGAVLSAGQQIVYPIPVQLPSNVTPGTHNLIAYVSYRWLKSGTWTGVLAGFWVSSVPFAYPQVVSQTPAMSTTQQTTQQMFSSTTLETAAVLILVVAIGLFLERRRIGKLVKKPKPQQPETPVEAPATTNEPAVQEKQEEDL